MNGAELLALELYDVFRAQLNAGRMDKRMFGRTDERTFLQRRVDAPGKCLQTKPILTNIKSILALVLKAKNGQESCNTIRIPYT